jgi:uncharacterized membrane protein HdeD (DUF308 family)
MHELTAAADSLRLLIRKTWWISLVQGLAALVIGILLITRPAPTLVLLTIAIGAYWLVGGIFDAVGAVTRRQADRHWVLALMAGLFAAAAGLLLLGRPVLGFLVTSVMVITLIAIGAMLSGLFSVVWAIRVRREIHGEVWIVLLGILSILFGLLLLASPVVSVVALIQLVAVLAILGGVMAIVTAVRLRRAIA